MFSIFTISLPHACVHYLDQLYKRVQKLQNTLCIWKFVKQLSKEAILDWKRDLLIACFVSPYLTFLILLNFYPEPNDLIRQKKSNVVTWKNTWLIPQRSLTTRRKKETRKKRVASISKKNLFYTLYFIWLVSFILNEREQATENTNYEMRSIPGTAKGCRKNSINRAELPWLCIGHASAGSSGDDFSVAASSWCCYFRAFGF